MIYRGWEKVVSLGSFQPQLRTKITESRKKPVRGLAESTFSVF